MSSPATHLVGRRARPSTIGIDGQGRGLYPSAVYRLPHRRRLGARGGASGLAMASSSEGVEELEARLEPAEDAPLDPYDENDELVTCFVELPREEPRWLVQITTYDRRSMSRERLLAELRGGGLVHADTLVWRHGMRNWSSVARVGELGAPETLPPTRRAAGSSLPRPGLLSLPPSPNEAAVVLASSAASALVVVGVTLALLAWGGVFEAGAGAQAPNPTPASSGR
jgi:hypothetical protein